MPTRRAIAIIGAAVALAAALASTMAAAGTRTQKGQIAFSRFRFVDSPVRREIWAANPNGTGLHRLTNAPANYRDSDPDWATNGRSLVFTRCAPLNGVPGAGRCTVWSVNADGSEPRMLSSSCSQIGPSCADDGGARYSPDSREIALLRFNGVSGGIAITDSSLGHARSLYPFGNAQGVPDIGGLAWSPDGKKLAFTADNDNGTNFKPVGGRALFVIGVDGSGLRRLTPWRLKAGWELDWSPDGGHIVFRSVTCCDAAHPGPPGGNLYTIRPNGTHLRQLTHIRPIDGVQLGSYSPDSRWIVFSTRAHATPLPNGGGSYTDVYEIKADGSHRKQITHTKNWEGTPDWGG